MNGRIFKILVFSLFFLFLGFSARAADFSDCVNINTAPKEELERIKHIGEARAGQILNLREEKLFSSVDDLDRVVGIGPSRIADIKEQGLACVKIEGLQPEPGPELPAESQGIQAGPPACETCSGEPEATSTEEFYEVQPRKIGYPSGVVINEILPSPTGPDEEEEWIEIFNLNNLEVNLSNWRITDAAGKTETYTFPEGTSVGPAGFLVLNRPTTRITLNNQGDGLRLTQPNGDVADEMSYQNAPRGESYSRFSAYGGSAISGESGWAWASLATPGSANLLPVKNIEPEKVIAENIPPQVGLAAVGEQMPKNRNVHLLFFVAIFTSFFGGAIILILKKKLKLG